MLFKNDGDKIPVVLHKNPLWAFLSLWFDITVLFTELADVVHHRAICQDH
mgnify:CR=1 FL=1